LHNISEYFTTAVERERIRRRRLAGQIAPWTSDPIFQEWRFTNVHRENDKTTTWFRENIRTPLCILTPEPSNKRIDYYAQIQIIFATIAFRWFNRIETGEKIKDLLLGKWDSAIAYERLKDIRPVTTGAFMTHSPYGMTKLEGILNVIDKAKERLPKIYSIMGWKYQSEAHAELCELENMGSFSAGEIVWDLRWTPVLDGAPDINTWTVAGPGCARGLGYALDGNPHQFNYGNKSHQVVMLKMMTEILEMSRDTKYWPSEFEPWELHEVEMWACEYAKYRSAREGNRLKRRFTCV